MNHYATTLRRLMVERGLTVRQVIEATRLHERTIKGVLRGTVKPHARTLHQLAAGLGFEAREFFPGPDTSTAVVVPIADKPILEQAAVALQGEYRDLLVGTIKLIGERGGEQAGPEMKKAR